MKTKKNYNIGSHLILHDYDKGVDFNIWIKNINRKKSPEEQYEIDIENLDGNGHSYYDVFNSYYACGEYVLDKLELIEKNFWKPHWQISKPSV